MPETIHRRRLFGGRMTAEEYWRREMARSGLRCACGSRVIAVVARTWYPHGDLIERHGDLAGAIMAANPDGPFLPTADFLGPGGVRRPYVFVGKTAACPAHEREMVEHAARTLPTYALVELDPGPGPERTVIQMP